MGIEIEKKYLVDKALWEKSPKEKGEVYTQGYIPTQNASTVRIRQTETSGFITIKGPRVGISRPEYEYPIPIEEAKELLDRFCTNILSKIRHKLMIEGKLWEVDVFLDDNEGLIIAEIELSSEDESFVLPHWVTEDVTFDNHYANSYLAQYPFKSWKK